MATETSSSVGARLDGGIFGTPESFQSFSLQSFNPYLKKSRLRKNRAHNARSVARGADVEKLRPRAHHFSANGWSRMV